MSHNSKATKAFTKSKIKSAQNSSKAEQKPQDLSNLWQKKMFNPANKSVEDIPHVELEENSENEIKLNKFETFFSYVESLFDELIDLGYVHNENFKSANEILTWTRPNITKENFRKSNSSVLIGRISSKNTTLIIRGLMPNLKAYIIPVDRLISFSSNPNNFKTIIELKLDDELCKWYLEENILPKNSCNLIAKKLYEMLKTAVLEKTLPDSCLKYEDLSTKATYENYKKSQSNIPKSEAITEKVELKVSHFKDNNDDIESIKNKLLSKIDKGPQFWNGVQEQTSQEISSNNETQTQVDIQPPIEFEEASIDLGYKAVTNTKDSEPKDLDKPTNEVKATINNIQSIPIEQKIDVTEVTNYLKIEHNKVIEEILKQLSQKGSQAFLNFDYDKANEIILISNSLKEFQANTDKFIHDINVRLTKILPD